MNINLTWIISLILSVVCVKSLKCDYKAQYESLVNLYKSTNGENWIHKWNLSDPDYWYAFSYCFFLISLVSDMK